MLWVHSVAREYDATWVRGEDGTSGLRLSKGAGEPPSPTLPTRGVSTHPLPSPPRTDRPSRPTTTGPRPNPPTSRLPCLPQCPRSLLSTRVAVSRSVLT